MIILPAERFRSKDASGAEDKTKTVSSASTLSELGYTGTGTIEVTNKETGKTTSISVTGDTKISDFVKSRQTQV